MLTAGNVVLTDQRLNELAERFRLGKVREYSGISFAVYLRDPDHYDSYNALLREEFATRRWMVQRAKEISGANKGAPKEAKRYEQQGLVVH